MPTTLDVEKQRFEFGDSWKIAFKYDDTAFYRKDATKLQGQVDGKPVSTRAVDILAFHEPNGLLLLEAKDFRGHRIANKPRLKDGEVALEVAVKVRDTVAALVGAARSSVNAFPSVELAEALSTGREVTVVLWVEDDTQRDEFRAKQQLATLTGLLKEKLAWLNVRVFALSSRVANRLSHVTVTNLRGAGQP